MLTPEQREAYRKKLKAQSRAQMSQQEKDGFSAGRAYEASCPPELSFEKREEGAYERLSEKPREWMMGFRTGRTYEQLRESLRRETRGIRKILEGGKGNCYQEEIGLSLSNARDNYGELKEMEFSEADVGEGVRGDWQEFVSAHRALCEYIVFDLCHGESRLAIRHARIN